MKIFIYIAFAAALAVVPCALGAAAETKNDAVQAVVVGAKDEHYRRFGLDREGVAAWEDGTRTGGADGTYEWWYFDAYMDDGSSLVIVFYTRSMMNPDAPLVPFATLEWSDADGTKASERIQLDASSFDASIRQCDVRIGGASIRGNLKEYEITFKNNNVDVTALLRSNVSPWRNKTGFRLYGDNEEYYAAWLCAVPEGHVTATVTLNGVTKTFNGSGYHDHNWGNRPLWQMQNDWYWGRAKAGPYVMITSFITTAKTYGFKTFTTFLLAKDGRIIADDADKVSFDASQIWQDKNTGIRVADKLVYLYDDEQTRYRVEYQRQDTILETSMMRALSESQRRKAQTDGNRMTYYRFVGDATVYGVKDGKPIAAQRAPSAIWELMYPGLLK